MNYAPEEKLEAVALVRDRHMTYREAGLAAVIAHNSIWNWRRQLEGSASDLYAFTRNGFPRKRGRMPNGQRSEQEFMDSLPNDPVEPKRLLLRKQFELDLKDAVVDISKKDPGAPLKRLTNREKSILVSALREKGAYSIGLMTSSLGLSILALRRMCKKSSASPRPLFTSHGKQGR